MSEYKKLSISIDPHPGYRKSSEFLWGHWISIHWYQQPINFAFIRLCVS